MNLQEIKALLSRVETYSIECPACSVSTEGMSKGLPCYCMDLFDSRAELIDYLDKNRAIEKLVAVASVAAELDKEFWFDPSVKGGTCLDCDANLNPHRWGKHAADCLFEKLHQVIMGGGE